MDKRDYRFLLDRISANERVIGSVFVGEDGEIFAANLPPNFDPMAVGVCGLAISLNSSTVIDRAGRGELTQIGARTTSGCIVVTEFGAGAIVTMTEGGDSKTLVPLMDTVAKLISDFK